MREKEKMIKFCPKCGSTELKIVTTPWRIHSGTFQENSCAKCGFEGTMAEGRESFRKEFLEKLKEEKQ